MNRTREKEEEQEEASTHEQLSKNKINHRFSDMYDIMKEKCLSLFGMDNYSPSCHSLYFFVSEDYLHETSKAFTFLLHMSMHTCLFLILAHHISAFSSNTDASASSTFFTFHS
ncbi:hypothetical protein RJT34_14356 [Clitoria ternatea]|uniref:Uncharacterized protein n=1 Tax=Clitoria ternatea TaxID=43366 RepID=A0AAN9JSH4_CLITE